MSVTLNGTSGLVFSDGTIQGTAAGMPFRNRIINGDMRIDQRNAGAVHSIPGLASTFTLDRWSGYNSAASKFTVQRNAGSVTPPAGFTNYLGATSLSAYTLSASDQFQVTQIIEGSHIADFRWGTASAKTVTVSFWVRSSLTGAFGFSLQNKDNNYCYATTYTINAANTWEYKTITIPGPTAGVWSTANEGSVQFRFAVGVGSNFIGGTANSWSVANYLAPSNVVNVVSTSGATLYITGVQLEAASAATEFEFRPIATELQLCRRYFVRYLGEGNYEKIPCSGIVNATTTAYITINLSTPMRSSPTLSYSNIAVFEGSVSANITDVAVDQLSTNSPSYLVTVAASPGLNLYRPVFIQSPGTTNSFLRLSAEI